jgi:signal transduction histidine kinase
MFRTSGWLDRSSWLFVLLVLLTLLPAAWVLWFMNEAVTTEAAAARQRVVEAYRGQLRLVRARIDAHWRDYAANLDGGRPPEQQFLHLIGQDIAEGAVVLGPDGSVVYPDRSTVGRVGPVPSDGPGASNRARPTGTVLTIERRLAAAEQLAPATVGRAVEALAATLNDYTVPIAAPTRLMLMDRLRRLAPNVFLPTQAALNLSSDLVNAERPAPTPGAFRETAIRDVWALTSADGRVIALYRTGRLEAMMHDFLHQVTPEGIRFIAFPPDVPADAEAIAAGPWLPGWQVSFVPLDMASFDAVGRRRTVYVSVALAGIAVITIIGVSTGRTLRRHLHVARLKTDLVAAASHELRTPLASMRVLVDGLLADAELNPSKTREYLEMVATENARLSRLIENFLTFSRLERSRHQFTFAPASPSAIVMFAVDAVRDRLPQSCDLQVDIAPALPSLMADADALGTALVNLLDNALKYTSDEKRIVVRACRDGQAAVQFVVADNGIGIPVGEQRRIFKHFYRVDQRLSRDTGGVGLGLSIVDLVVRGHGGTVSVRSAPGSGSTFTLRLPCAGQGAAA